MTIAVETLNRILILLVYFPACPLLYWWLVRRLPPWSRRLALIALAAQLIVVIVALFHTPASRYEQWLWDLDKEWNIPSMLSSAQLALVCAVALMASWRATRQRAWQRGILVGYAILFGLLAVVEYFSWRSSAVVPWYFPYLLLGISLSAITLIHIETSPKPTRMWLLYLLMAVWIIGMAGIVADEFSERCNTIIGFWRFEGCLLKNSVEEAIEFFGAWIALVAVLGHFGEVEPRPSARIRWTLFLIPAIWILLITQLYTLPPISQQTGTQGASVVFESGAKLHAYGVERRGRYYDINLYLSLSAGNFSAQGYSIHLIDATSGISIVGEDMRLHNPANVHMGPGYELVYRHWTSLRIPSDAPRNHVLLAVLSLWREDGSDFVAQKIRSSDLPLLGDTQIILGELVLPAESSPPPPFAPLAYFDNRFTLDPVTLPIKARAGEALSLPFTWRADIADDEEYAQFLHIGDEASGQWWIFDQHPLGPRLPTQFWYAGLADTEVWILTLPADIPSGRYSVFTGLYRTSDKERLPASEPNETPFVDARVPLGHLNISAND